MHILQHHQQGRPAAPGLLPPGAEHIHEHRLAGPFPQSGIDRGRVFEAMDEVAGKVGVGQHRELMVDPRHAQTGVVQLLVARRLKPGVQNGGAFRRKGRQVLVADDRRLGRLVRLELGTAFLSFEAVDLVTQRLVFRPQEYGLAFQHLNMPQQPPEKGRYAGLQFQLAQVQVAPVFHSRWSTGFSGLWLFFAFSPTLGLLPTGF